MPAVLSQAPTLQPSSKSKASVVAPDGAAKEHSTPTEGAAVVVTCVSSSSATTTHLANELPSTPSSDTVSLKLATPQGTVQRIVIDTRNRVGRLHYYPPWHCLFEDGNMLCNLVARRLPQPSSYLAPLEQGDGDGDGDGAQSFVCGLNGCRFVCERGTAEWQAHMLACHQFVCSECGRTLHSARFLDRHLLESHDALFKTLAATKKMYECLVDGCSKLFWDANGRRQHLLRYHQLSEASAAFFLSQVGNYRRRRKRRDYLRAKKEQAVAACATSSDATTTTTTTATKPHRTAPPKQPRSTTPSSSDTMAIDQESNQTQSQPRPRIPTEISFGGRRGRGGRSGAMFRQTDWSAYHKNAPSGGSGSVDKQRKQRRKQYEQKRRGGATAQPAAPDESMQEQEPEPEPTL